MRLIDADAMNEELFYKQLGGKDTLITAESAFNMIKAQPTAYDVEKVVKQIEEMFGCDPMYYGTEAKWAVDKAIEIVRGEAE